MKTPSLMKPKTPMFILAGLTGLFTAANVAISQTWVPTFAPLEPWKAIACSADGTKLVAAKWSLYCSCTDRGDPHVRGA